jgi:hypothetical protein
MDAIITALPQNGAKNEYLGVSALPDNTVVAMAYVPFHSNKRRNNIILFRLNML